MANQFSPTLSIASFDLKLSGRRKKGRKGWAFAFYRWSNPFSSWRSPINANPLHLSSKRWSCYVLSQLLWGEDQWWNSTGVFADCGIRFVSCCREHSLANSPTATVAQPLHYLFFFFSLPLISGWSLFFQSLTLRLHWMEWDVRLFASEQGLTRLLFWGDFSCSSDCASAWIAVLCENGSLPGLGLLRLRLTSVAIYAQPPAIDPWSLYFSQPQSFLLTSASLH